MKNKTDFCMKLSFPKTFLSITTKSCRPRSYIVKKKSLDIDHTGLSGLIALSSSSVVSVLVYF